MHHWDSALEESGACPRISSQPCPLAVIDESTAEGPAASAEGEDTVADDSSRLPAEGLDPECMYSPNESSLGPAAAGDTAGCSKIVDAEAGGGPQANGPFKRSHSCASASHEIQTNMQAGAALVRGSEERQPSSHSLVEQVKDAAVTPTSTPSPFKPHHAILDGFSALQLPGTPLGPQVPQSSAEGSRPLTKAPMPLPPDAAMIGTDVRTAGASKQQGIPSSVAPGTSSSAEGIPSSEPTGTSSLAEGIPASGVSCAAEGISWDGTNVTSLAEGVPNNPPSRQGDSTTGAIEAGTAQALFSPGPSQQPYDQQLLAMHWWCRLTIRTLG